MERLVLKIICALSLSCGLAVGGIGCDRGQVFPPTVEEQIRRDPPREAPPPAALLAAQRGARQGFDELSGSRSSRRAEPTLASAAAEALAQIGEPAVPALIAMLDDSDPAMRAEVAGILGRIGPEAAEAVPALMLLLRDQDLQVRSAAARALGEVGPAAAPAVPALLEVLQEQLRENSPDRRA